MRFDVQGALQAGYSHTEVADFLAEQKKFDVSGARAAGYSDDEIVGFVSSYEPPKPGLMERAGNFITDSYSKTQASPMEEQLGTPVPEGERRTFADARAQTLDFMRGGEQQFGNTMQGYDAPADPLIERRGAPVTPEQYDELRGLYESAAAPVRERMIATPGVRGNVWRALDKQYNAADYDLEATAPLDDRSEAQARRLRVESGAAPEVADNMTMVGMRAEDAAQATESPADRELIDYARDTANQVVRNVPMVGKMAIDAARIPGDVIPLVSEALALASEELGEVIDSFAARTSPQLREKVARMGELAQAGDTRGLVSLLGTNPDLLAEVAIPSIGSMFLIGAAGATVGRSTQAGMVAQRAAQQPLLRQSSAAFNRLLAARTSESATRGALAANVGVVAGAAFDETDGPQDAKYLAAVIAGTGALIAGKITQGGAEGMLARAAVGTRAGGAITAVPRAMLREGGQEYIEEGGEALGAQAGEVYAGTRDGFDLPAAHGQGVIGAAAGMVLGGAVGGITTGPTAPAPRRAQQLAAAQAAEQGITAAPDAASAIDAFAGATGATSDMMRDVLSEDAAAIDQQMQAERAAQEQQQATPILDPEMAGLEQEAALLDADALLAEVEARFRPSGTLEVTGKGAEKAVKAIAPNAPISITSSGSVLVSARFAGPVFDTLQSAKIEMDQIRRMSGLPGEVDAAQVDEQSGTGSSADVSRSAGNAPLGDGIGLGASADAGASVAGVRAPAPVGSAQPDAITQLGDIDGPTSDQAQQGQQAAAQEAPTRDSLIAQYEQAEPMSPQSDALAEQLKAVTQNDVEATLNSGDMPVFETGRNTFVTITPSAQQPGKYQLTRYNNGGVFGDTQYDSIEAAIRDNSLETQPRLTQQEAESRLSASLKAEAEYQAKQAPTPAQAAPTPQLTASGKPFKTERAAATSAKQKGLDLVPVAVEGGWGLVPKQAEQAAPVTPTAVPKARAATNKRRAAYAEGNPFRAFLGSAGGVSRSVQSDVMGDTGRTNNPMIPYAGPVFRANGRNLDELAMLALEAGFLTQADIDSPGDMGGTRKLADMIRGEWSGTQQTRIQDVEAGQDARSESDDALALVRQLEAVGIDTGAMSVEDMAAALEGDTFEAALADVVNALTDDISFQRGVARAAQSENVGYTDDLVSEEARIAIANEINEDAVERAAMQSEDQVDYLSRIEEIIRNADQQTYAAAVARNRQATEGRPGSASRDSASTAESARAAPSSSEAESLTLESYTPVEAGREEGSESQVTRAPWQMTSAEFAQSELDQNEYKEAYEADPELKAEFLQNQLIPWRRALEQAGRERVLPDRVLDDYVAQFGEAALAQTFRGNSEIGASQWEPAKTRLWDKTYKQFLAHHADLTVKGNKKDVHRTAVKRALEQGKDVPANVLKDYPELTQAESLTAEQKQAQAPYIKLLGLASTELLSDQNGRKIYAVTPTAAFKRDNFVVGRGWTLPRTDGFEFAERSRVTGNPADNGYVLIDKREQLAARQAPPLTLESYTPAELAERQAARADPDAITREQADRERDATPYTLDGGSQSKPQGEQGGMFTPDGRVSEDQQQGERRYSNDPQRWIKYTQDFARDRDQYQLVATKDGVDYFYRPEKSDPGHGFIIAATQDGTVAGETFFGPQGAKGEYEGAVQVAPQSRRKGIATQMYGAIEQVTGGKMRPAEKHTADAEAFWQARRERASGQSGLFAETPRGGYSGQGARQNDTYTTDLFGQPLPDASVPDSPRAVPDVARAEEVFAAGQVEGAKYATEAGPRTTGQISSAYATVENAEQAAHTVAGLRKLTEERFQVLVLDDSNKPIAVLNLFAGGTTQTSAYPDTVAKAVYETPGAARIWLVHNHPSGTADPSTADERLTRTLAQAFGTGTGVEMAGHVVIAGTRFTQIDDMGRTVGKPGAPIPAGARTQTIRVTERRFTKVGRLDDVIDSPTAAREIVARIADGKPGIVFLDARNGPTGFLPMTWDRMARLRERGNTRTLFGAAARSNAVAAIVYFPKGTDSDAVRSAVRNMGEALGGRGITVLDALVDVGSRIRSFAETGEAMNEGRGGVFMSFAGPNAATADTMALETAKSRIESGENAETVRRETGWFKGAADGKWRFEINDSDAFTKGTGAFGVEIMRWYRAGVERTGDQLYKTTVGDMIYHPALFAAYPQLANIEVQMIPKGVKANARVVETDGAAPIIQVNESLPKDRWLSAMLHELQHGIQNIEGFATGGSANAMTTEVTSRREIVDAYGAFAEQLQIAGVDTRNMPDLDALLIDPDQTIEDYVFDVPRNAENSSEVEWAADALTRAINAGSVSPFQQYRRLAGEVEARNTQTRQGMTDAERQATPPSATADVADADVIVVFNGTEMASAPAPANSRAGTPTTITPVTTLTAAFKEAFPNQANTLDRMIQRGENGQRGGVVFAEDEAALAQAFADKTGRTLEEAMAVLQMSKTTSKEGRIRRTLNELVDAAQSQETWRTWYERHETVLIEVFGADADLFQGMLSATSQATGVKGNVTLALKAYEQMMTGQEFTGFLPAVIKNLERIRDNQALQGAKISQYGEANKGDTDAIAVDRHIAMLFFNTKTPNPRQIAAAKQRISKIAEQLGWEPRQVQAALWAYNQVRLGADPSKVQSYDTIIKERADAIADLRTRLGRGSVRPAGATAGRDQQAGRPAGRDQDGNVDADTLAETGDFKTGQPVTFSFIHNTDSATALFGKPKKGDTFQRDMEPSGRYVIAGESYANMPSKLTTGELTFQNPLVIKAENWKQALFDHYGRRGKRLSEALIADGYDGVVTVDSYGTSEILDLTTFDVAKALYSKDGTINGFYDPQSGLTFLNQSAVTADTIGGVMLHEAMHGGQNADVDAKAMKMVADRDKASTPATLRPILDDVAARMEAAGVANDAREASAYIVEAAANYGRQNGFSVLDGKFMTWLDGKQPRLAKFLRDWIAGIRAWGMKHGINLNPTVDDLVAFAQQNMNAMARGEAVTGSGPVSGSMGGKLAQTATAAFKKWFGDSKVVDESGEPLVVYHGTTAEIEDGVFKPGTQPHDAGIFFTSKASVAGNVYAGGIGKFNAEGVRARLDQMTDTELETVFEKLGKRFRSFDPWGRPDMREDVLFEMQERFNEEGPMDSLVTAFGEMIGARVTAPVSGANVLPVYLSPQNPLEIDGAGLAFDPEQQAEWLAQAKAGNHDGLIIRNYEDGGFGYAENYRSAGRHDVFVVFNPAKIKSATGNIGTFDGTNPDIRFSRSGTPGPGSLAQGGGRGPGPQPAAPAETLARKAQRVVQDKLNRFTVIKEWLVEQGVRLSEAADVYKAEERMHSKFANKAEDFREKRLKPLVEKIQKAGFSMDDVAQFLHAQHAEERNVQVAKVNANKPDGGSGMKTAEARTILAAASPELKALSNEVRAITEDSLKMLAENRIPQSEADAYRKAYSHYVPLKGGPESNIVAGTGKGLKPGHKSKRALGHEMREGGEWIIENILADHERALMEVEKVRVGHHLLKMALEMGRDDIISIGKPEKRQVLRNNTAYEVLLRGQVIGTFNSEEAARVFRQTAAASMGGSPSNMGIRKTSDPMVVLMASPQLADNEVNVYVKGNAIRLQINDDLLARAYGNMGAEATATIFRAGRALNRYFSTIYTGYNPEFILTNIIRDFTTGLANITGEEGVTMALRAMKNYAGAFGNLLKYAATGKADKWIRMYREDGGNTGAAYLSDIERLGADVKRDYAAYKGVLENLKSGDKAGAARAAGQKTFMRVLDIIRYMNEAGENAMRVSAYKAMIESGRTRAEAASLSKNATVNFNRKGEMGSKMNAAYLFFNAAVQGTAAIAHAHAKGKHKKQAWAVSSGMVALGYTMAMALGGGDDEDEYDQLPDFVKERNMVIKTEDGWIKIPVPYGYGFFWSLGRHLADAQRTGKTEDLSWKIGVSFVEEMTPFGAMVAGDEPDAKQAILFGLPTAVQVAAAPHFNVSSFGGPIMPTSMSDKTQPDRDRMWRGTRGTLADELSGALAEAGFDVSPESIKFQWRTFTGGAGTMVTSTIDAARLKAAGSDLEVKEMPFVRKLYGQSDVRDTRSAYWSAVKEAEAVSEAFGRAKRANDTATMRQIATDDRELLALAKLANRWGKVVSAERDRIDAVRLSGLYTKAEERAIIKDMEKREREIYQRYLDIFKARTRPD